MNRYRYDMICSLWSELCVLLMLQLSFCSCGGNGSPRNGMGILLLQLLRGEEESRSLWALLAKGSLTGKREIK